VSSVEAKPDCRQFLRATIAERNFHREEASLLNIVAMSAGIQPQEKYTLSRITERMNIKNGDGLSLREMIINASTAAAKKASTPTTSKQ